ncbi:MAG: (d)CMP kinase [Pirellulaceae bacterium]
MVVTIDGPAGAGKSTAAKRLASELGFRFLDTGAMYRAVTWIVLKTGTNPLDAKAVSRLANRTQFVFEESRVLVDGQDVTTLIRTREIARNIGPIADNPEVRNLLISFQQEIGAQGNIVTEGRDQGTVVFPDAECKIFLTASPEYRARRRVIEMERQGVPADYPIILSEQSRRDEQDRTRAFGCLRKADDAIEIDTDDMTLDEVVERLKAEVRSVRERLT